MATDVVQVNARLSRSLRDEGEEALASIGLTPSAAIRALWKKAAKRGADLDEVRTLLASEPEVDPEIARKLEILDEAQRHIAALMESMGLSADSAPPPLTDDELLEQAWHERMLERGLA